MLLLFNFQTIAVWYGFFHHNLSHYLLRGYSLGLILEVKLSKSFLQCMTITLNIPLSEKDIVKGFSIVVFTDRIQSLNRYDEVWQSSVWAASQYAYTIPHQHHNHCKLFC